MESGDLTRDQQETLNQFRTRVKDVLRPEHDDYFLSRWLIARSWNLGKAEKMLRKNVEWRKLHDMDNITKTWIAPELLKTYVPGGFCGLDKEGSPVWIETLGNVDMKGLFHTVRVRDLIRNRLYILQHSHDILERERQKRGKHPGGITMIYDFENFGLKQLWKPGVDLVGELFHMSETNFPELLKACYVVKAPALFSIAFNLVKPFLHEKTKKKIYVLGADWKERVLEAIDADQLPVYWGGSQTDPDGDLRCPSKISLGGDVPESCYARHQENVERSDLTHTVINKGSTLDVNLEVNTIPSVIRWEYVTEEHDVAFGLFRRASGEDGSGLEEVVVSRRVNCHMVPDVGTTLVTTPGHYVARFDNTYSWINGKKLHYGLHVTPQEDGAAPTGPP